MIAADIFTISGPGSSKPIPFSAQVAVHVGSWWYATATVDIGSGVQAQEFATPPFAAARSRLHECGAVARLR